MNDYITTGGDGGPIVRVSAEDGRTYFPVKSVSGLFTMWIVTKKFAKIIEVRWLGAKTQRIRRSLGRHWSQSKAKRNR